jgi:membrane fusion protein (multidrug efflux system)
MSQATLEPDVTELMEREALQERVDERNNRTPRQEKAPRNKLAIGLVAGLLVTIAAAVAAYFYLNGQVSTDNAQVDGHIVPVASKIYGTVAEVLVNDNQKVRAGDVLVRIDPRDYQARVDQAKAALAMAESQARAASAGVPVVRGTTAGSASEATAQMSGAQAEVAKAQAEYERASTAELSAAQSAVQAAQAQNERAQADLQRMRPLADKEEISKLQFDAYQAAARVADSQLRAAQQQYESARQNIGTRKASLAAAQARVAQAQAGIEASQASRGQVNVRAAEASSAVAAIAQARANLETVQLQLSYTAITAPVNGIVTKKSAEVGQIVQQGQGLMTIVPVDDVWVTANFKETQLAGVKVGQRAEVKVDLDGRKYEGRVDSIAGATGARMSLLPPENATGNFVKVVQRIPVKVVLQHVPADALIRPGMNVDTTIFTK